jgi:uncharacterized protein (TIGR02145 family)
MKKLLLLVLLALTSQTIKAQADAFITTWVTDVANETLTLPTQVDAPNYTINWGDGTATNTYNATQAPSHTYSNAGEHTISFTGTFPHLTFVGQTKLKAVQQWGTQKWTSMANMFEGCRTLNSFPSQNPDLFLCTDMSWMFNQATAFNQPIGPWNVSNVIDMGGMFAAATSFNQPIESWNVSNVTNMSYMFYEAINFNQNIGSWNVSKVTNMSNMFADANAFNQPIGSWNVSQVKNMSKMFGGCAFGVSPFNQPLDSWDVSQVTDMNRMFFCAVAFNQPIDSWDVSNVTDMSGMFSYAYKFNQPIGSWNVSKVTNMSYMFMYLNGEDGFTNAFDQPIGSWDVSQVRSMDDMFIGTKLSTGNYDDLLIGWATRGANGGVLQQGVAFSGGNSSYCNSVEARNYLINTYGWRIDKNVGYDCSGLNTNIITEIIIGTQTWSDKNLDVTTYSDGTEIPQVTDPTEWANLATGAWCYYNYGNKRIIPGATSFGTAYGKLYNWYAVAGIWSEASKTDVSQRKKLAPTGYHVPSDAEWATLISFLGGDTEAGGKMKEKSPAHWVGSNIGATNSSGFTGLPGGNRTYNGMFEGFGDSGWWWSSSENHPDDPLNLYLVSNTGNAISGHYEANYGLSVRYLKDNALSNIKFETNSFKIYPNPVRDNITIDCDNLSNIANQPYTITDALGKIILKGKLNEGNNSINVEQLSNGIYYLKVATNKASKFIKE